jgi:hypothetical protein
MNSSLSIARKNPEPTAHINLNEFFLIKKLATKTQNNISPIANTQKNKFTKFKSG